MSYIQPNSRIEFFDDIGISQDYNDTLYFPTLAAKDTYFSNIDRLAHVDKCYYARENRGFVRVELPMNTMIHAQYMRFKNTSYENKWWYAFVKDVNYINDNTTEVQFELDPMMTWMGEFSLSNCFIERQHSETDVVGDNLVDEPVNCGEYTNSFANNGAVNHVRTGLFGNWVYMVFVSEPTVIANPVAKALGIYSGLSVYIYGDNNAGLTAMTTFLKLDGILQNTQMICYVPEDLIPRIPNYELPYSGATDYSSADRELAPIIKLFAVDGSFSTIDGYEPRNKKLFTYPYNMLAVWNSEDKDQIYKYELFKREQGDTRVWFNIQSNISEKSEIICAPRSYRNIGVNYSEGSYMREFPMCSWVSDAWMAYLAQTLTGMPVRLLTAGLVDGLFSITSTQSVSSSVDSLTRQNVEANGQVMPPVRLNGQTLKYPYINDSQEKKSTPSIQLGPAMSRTILSELMSGLEHSVTPNSSHGQASTDVMVVNRQKDFWFYRRTVRAEYAKIIDNYFTMFGYAQKKLGTPNMNARQRFTYVKTIGCKINCRCPASDADFIENLFNRGIRFWKNHTQIGNYSDDNLPIA